MSRLLLPLSYGAETAAEPGTYEQSDAARAAADSARSAHPSAFGDPESLRQRLIHWLEAIGPAHPGEFESIIAPVHTPTSPPAPTRAIGSSVLAQEI